MADLAKTTTITLGPISIDAVVVDNDAYVSVEQMATLFGVGARTLQEHVQHLYAEGEISAEATTRSFRVVRSEGNRSVNRECPHYSSLAVVHVGYRVRSDRGVEFRRWVTSVLTGETKPPSTALASDVDPMLGTLARLTDMIGVVAEMRRAQLDMAGRVTDVEEAHGYLLSRQVGQQDELNEFHQRLVAVEQRPLQLAAPAAPALPPRVEEATPRGWTSHLVRRYAQDQNLKYQAVWRLVYEAFDQRMGVNIAKLTREWNQKYKSKLTRIAVAEQLGWSTPLYEAAKAVCGHDPLLGAGARKVAAAKAKTWTGAEIDAALEKAEREAEEQRANELEEWLKKMN